MTRAKSQPPAKQAPTTEHSDEQLRLELLKLTHAHGQPVEEVIGRTQKLESYVKNGSDNPFT